MKLQELAASDPVCHATKVFENHFGTRIAFDQLTLRQACQMLDRVRGLMQEHKQTVIHHFREQDPAYLKLVVMETALASRVREEMVPTTGAATSAQSSGSAAAKPAAAKPAVNVKDPKLAAALKKSQSGQTLSPDEQKLVVSAALMQQEIREEMVPTTGAATSAQSSGSAAAKPAAAKPAVNVKDPKLAAALKKSQSGQTLSPDEQKLVVSAALMQQENRLRSAYRTLNESEVQQAQVVLAAQDMVDKMQGMLEDTTEMQFKELPALVDSIRNQTGMDQANQFNTDATAALTGLVKNLQAAKQQLEVALGIVTGQQPATPTLDAAMDAGNTNMSMPPDNSMDLAVDTDLDTEEPADGKSMGTKGTLGRARR
jgi:hypothetical protein